MKLKHTLRLTVLAVVAGSLMAPVLQAQSLAVSSQAGKGPAYYVADFDLKDPEAIKPYRDQVDATFKPYSGRYVVRAGQLDRLEGNPPSHRLIIIKFDSLEQARAWYNSPEYARIRPFRQRSGHTDSYIVEGLAE